MTSELRPCPFCGGEARFEIDTDGSFMLEVEHESWCFLTSMDTRQWYYCDTVEEAAQDWNQRAERTCKNVSVTKRLFECSACSYYYPDLQDFRYCPECGAKVVEL